MIIAEEYWNPKGLSDRKIGGTILIISYCQYESGNLLRKTEETHENQYVDDS